jgi:broad specificity phosphatase PhoE
MSWYRIYLLRHGETDWNQRKLFRGHSEIGLSEKGRGQAVAAARALADKDITAILTSPAVRSLETARICSQELELEYTKTDSLADPDCGLWTGKDMEEVRKNHPHEFSMMWISPSNFGFPGGESVVEVAERVSAFLSDLDVEVHENLLLITHNFIFQVFTMLILESPLDSLYKVEMANGAISEYVRDGQAIKMIRMNDRHHLADI